MYFLALTLVPVFIYLWWRDFRLAYRKSAGLDAFMNTHKARETAYFLAVILLPMAAVNYLPIGNTFDPNDPWIMGIFSLLVSFAISFVWYRYLNWIDLFEKEHWVYAMITFFMGCCTTFLVFPLTGVINQFFQLNGDPWNDWWYCVFAIGLVEELVKIIPVLIMLRMSRQINEPFDYIFYGSISALGFAFVENVLYLQNSHLHAVYGRALYSSVAHMFFTSIICYGVLLSRHHNYLWRSWALPVFLLLAAFGHGFYDFWLINPVMSEFSFITTVFFLVTIHFWIIMQNNLVNISNYFDPTVKLNAQRVKYGVINGLITVFYMAYFFIFLMYGATKANDMLLRSWIFNIYVLIYLAMSLGSFEVIRGYIEPFRLSLQMIMPKMKVLVNRVGTTMLIDMPKKHNRRNKEWLYRLLPLQGRLMRRVVVAGDPSWYLLTTDVTLPVSNIKKNVLLVRPLVNNNDIASADYQMLVVMGIKRGQEIVAGRLSQSDVAFIHYLPGRSIDHHT